ncbi:hypothetical protein ACFLTB_05260 [Chloroflexota bacterium]
MKTQSMKFNSSKGTMIIPPIFLLICSFTFMAYPLVGCTPTVYEPEVDIRIHNQTNETLEIFDIDYYITRIEPGGVEVWETAGIFPDYTITAKDMDGNTVYEITWTNDDMKGKEMYDVYLPPSENGAESSDNGTMSENITKE